MRYISLIFIAYFGLATNCFASAYGQSTIYYDDSVVPPKVVYFSQTSVDFTEAYAYAPAIYSTLYEGTSPNLITLSSTNGVFTSYNPSYAYTYISDTRVAYNIKPSTAYEGRAQHYLTLRISGWPTAIGWLDVKDYLGNYPLYSFVNGVWIVTPFVYPSNYQVFTPLNGPNPNYVASVNPYNLGLQGTKSTTYTPSSFNSYGYIDRLGFKGDIRLYKWEFYNNAGVNVQHDPGDVGTPVWDQLYPYSLSTVFYAQNTPVKLKARLKLSRYPEPNLTASIRVRAASKPGNPIVGQIDNVNILQSLTINLPDIQLNSSYTFTNKVGWVLNASNPNEPETFTWEISYYNTGTWVSIGQTPASIGWTYANPYTPLSYFFKDYFNMEYEYAYDEILSSAVWACTGDTMPGQMLQHLNDFVHYNGFYDPNAASNGATHPWKNLYAIGQCSDKAQILTGLARSFGLSTETKYYWGGDNDMSSNLMLFNVGQGTLRVSRPAVPASNISVNLSVNRQFYFHAVTYSPLFGGAYFDPSYGLPYANVDLEQAANPSTGGCYIGSANANQKRRMLGNPVNMNMALQNQPNTPSFCTYP
jgi:hypothetical protein